MAGLMNSTLTQSTARELIMALTQIHEAIRAARSADRVDGSLSAVPSPSEDIAALVVCEQRILHELRRRRNVTRRITTWYSRNQLPPAHAS